MLSDPQEPHQAQASLDGQTVPTSPVFILLGRLAQGFLELVGLGPGFQGPRKTPQQRPRPCFGGCFSNGVGLQETSDTSSAPQMAAPLVHLPAVAAPWLSPACADLQRQDYIASEGIRVLLVESNAQSRIRIMSLLQEWAYSGALD